MTHTSAYPHVSLSASAGSGKTYALTLRLLGMLMRGVPPETVLCTTFTNKATHEMAERLMARIDTLAGWTPDDAEKTAKAAEILANMAGRQRDDVGLDEIADASLRARAARNSLLENYSRLNIVTMDSFFNSIIRLFPFETGVSPDFEIMTDAEDAGVFRAAMDRLVAEIEKMPEDREILKSLTLSLSRTVNDPNALLKERFDTLSPRRAGIRHLAEKIERAAVIASMKRLDETAAMATAAAHSFGAALVRHEGAMSESGRKAVRKCLNAQSPQDALSLTPFQKETCREYSFFKKLPPDDLLDTAFDDARSQLAAYIAAKNEFVISALLFFFQRYIAIADGRKREMRRLSFSDIERLCFELLAGDSGESPGFSAVRDDREFFYYRLDTRLKHLLMDEFQDTNTVQWEIFRPIVEEITADSEGSFFYVGDPKQAIYRFRGGESGLFEFVRASLADRIETGSLTNNYRSTVTIVEFVNRVFGSVQGRFDYAFEPQGAYSQSAGFVEITGVPRPERGSDADPVGDAVVERVKSLLGGGVPAGEVAVLCRKNDSCIRIAELLESAGIATQTEKKDTLLSSNAVRTVVGLLRYLADSSAKIHLADFIAQLPDIANADGLRRLRQAENMLEALKNISPEAHERIRRIRNSVDFAPVKSVVAAIIREFGLGARFADAENLLRLIEVSGGFTGNGVNGLRGFLDDLDRYGDGIPLASPTRANAVQLLTVHKAKGLEFGAVILPEVDDDITFNRSRSDFMFPCDGQFRLEGIYLTPSKDELPFAGGLAGIYRREERKNLVDELNLLYVALTRAKTGLFIISAVKPPSKKNDDEPRLNWFSLTAEALGIGQIPAEALGIGQIPVEALGVDAGKAGALPAVLYCEGDMSAFRPVEAIAAETVPEARDGIPRLAAGAAARIDETGEDDGDDEYATASPGNFLARKFGEAFHIAMENLPPIPDAERAYSAAVARYGRFLDENARKRLRRAIESAARHPGLLSLMRGGRVMTELPITLPGGAMRKADAVFVTDSEVVVVDYKTGYNEAMLPRYREQVGEYARLLGGLMPGRKTRGMLVFVDGKGARMERVG
ncbi:MAG: UvrD-helicase domain-containing protein [Nitrospirae bacterium]|nr:UvrD-helicase domain-containing protein [Nitrospirota bacterium]